MIIDFYVPFFREIVHESSKHDAKLKFIQPTLEDRYKNSEFLMMIDFYISFLE